LSFGNSGSGKGSFERKNKRRKQTFHTHKIRPNAAIEKNEDPEALKTKVIISLSHLGEQKFSAEPGGYTFENWMKSFNLLLDDFETRAGPKNLPKEYYSKRLELTSSLYAPASEVKDLDSRLNSIRDEEQNLRRAIALKDAKDRAEKEKTERDEKMNELEEEINASQAELDELKKRIATRKKETKESKGFFRKFVSSLSKPPDTTPIETLEARSSELDSKIQLNSRKISDLKIRNEKGELFLPDDVASEKMSVDEMQTRLSEIISEIEKLEKSMQEIQQLTEKRKEVTQQLSDVISKITFAVQSTDGA
jgi:DNA repair exonuclease SbcCD ATPase subunit